MGNFIYRNGQIFGASDIDPSIISSEYSPSTTYEENDYCMHAGKLFRCTSETTGAFDATKWSEEALTDQLTAMLNMPLADNVGY